MKRRDLLRRTALGTAGALTLAGCVSDGAQDSPGGAPDEESPTPTETATPTETPTPSPPSLAGAELTSTDADCASEDDRTAARVEFGDGTVGVSGSAGTPDPCYTASLSGAEYDPDRDELVVTVGVSSEGGVCASCLGAVTYEAAMQFENGLPGTVTVRHTMDDETTTVTTATR